VSGGRGAGVDAVLCGLARLLPPLARERYLEEWRADAAGAVEAGLSRRDVVLGAAALSLTIDRDAPAHSGEPRGMRPRRLTRRGFALFAAASVILLGAYLTGGGIVPEGAAATAGVVAALEAVGRLAVVLALAVAAVGALYLARAARAVETRTARATLVAAIVGLAATLAGALVPGAPGWLLAMGAGALVVGFVGGIAVLGGTRAIQLEPRTAPRRHRVVAAGVGLAVVVLLVVIGAIDLLVWNPLAKVPGLDLSTIYSRMESEDGFFFAYNAVLVAVWAAVWVIAAGITFAVGSRRPASWFTPRRIAVVMLGIVGGAVFFRFFAGFGFGMSIADTFVTTGGDASLASAVLPYVGQPALASAAVALGWAPRVPSARPAPPRGVTTAW
jgi:MFS family permease